MVGVIWDQREGRRSGALALALAAPSGSPFAGTSLAPLLDRALLSILTVTRFEFGYTRCLLTAVSDRALYTYAEVYRYPFYRVSCISAGCFCVLYREAGKPGPTSFPA